MEKKNLILADCEAKEIEEFVKGLQENIGERISIQSKICNGKHSFINNILRYFIYIFFPLKFVFQRKKYNYIIAWQQFFSLFFVFYCRLFRLKKVNIIVAGNFTYKSKKGFIGKLYKKVINYCINNEYLDYMHVPSREYAEACAKEFNIDIKKFIVTTFGLHDTYNLWKDTTVEYKDYALAIGRSNRDYDFLIKTWKKLPVENKLVIICDQYKANEKLPDNIILRDNIIGNKQFPYIMNCKLMIIPIKEGNICSGDTVLLKAMSYCKTVVVTKPSTLAEMYIKDGENGICIEKDEEKFAKVISDLMCDEIKLDEIGKRARKAFVDNFSRYTMGKKIGEILKEN